MPWQDRSAGGSFFASLVAPVLQPLYRSCAQKGGDPQVVAWNGIGDLDGGAQLKQVVLLQ